LVSRVAPLPDSQSRWGNPDLKVYATEIVVTDKLPDIKPGVSARAEIVITNMTDVLSIPLQAITTRKGKPVVFLAGAREPVTVTVGMYNTKFIQVSSGLKAGDQVLLAPPFDAKEKDLGGAIFADGEAPPADLTNHPVLHVLGRTNGGNGHVQLANGAHSALVAAAAEPPVAARANQIRQTSLSAQKTGSRTNRLDLQDRFDADHDGKLSDAEMATMRQWLSRHPGTNVPPAVPLVN
jgi:hypothetical protein